MRNFVTDKSRAFAANVVWLLAALGIHNCGVAAELVRLGFLPDPARSVSDNGYVGSGDGMPLRWSQATGIEYLGVLPGQTSGSARYLSNDGSTIVGIARIGSPPSQFWNEIFHYSDMTGIRPLGFLFELRESQDVNGISSDGLTVVGGATDSVSPGLPSLRHPFRWTEATGMVSLGMLPGKQHAEATDVSGDGSVVVGYSWNHSDYVREAFIWRAADGMAALNVVVQFDHRSVKLSRDGTVVGGTGFVTSPTDYEGFRWTEQIGAVGLGWLPGTQQADGSYFSAVRGVNADGSVIIGFSGSPWFNAVPADPTRAFIWTEKTGMQDLQHVLVDEYGLHPDLQHWTRLWPQEISDNGQLIVGRGINPEGTLENWLIQLDRPLGIARGDFDADGQMDCADVDSLVLVIVKGTNNLRFDLTGDGSVDTADLSQWLADAGAVNLASGNPYRPGDGNLDGHVDGSDFGVWNANKLTSVAAWCSGDFNADGVVDGSDFGIWNAHKFTSSATTIAVPETSGAAPAILSSLLLLFRHHEKPFSTNSNPM